MAISGRVYSSDYPEDARVVKARNATLEYSIQNLGSQQENLQIDISTKSGARVFARDTVVTLGSRQSYNGIALIGTQGDQDTFDNVVVSHRKLITDFDF